VPATHDELEEALEDYVDQVNASARVAKVLGAWRCRIACECTDIGETITLRVEEGRIAESRFEQGDDPQLVIRATSEQFVEIFWGEINPAELYNKGEIAVEGSQDDLLRLDGMAMLVFLG
jgi:hypothetical protein